MYKIIGQTHQLNEQKENLQFSLVFRALLRAGDFFEYISGQRLNAIFKAFSEKIYLEVFSKVAATVDSSKQFSIYAKFSS